MPTLSKSCLKRVGQESHLRRLPIKQLLLWGIAIAVIAIFGVAQFDGKSLWAQIQQFSWIAIALSLGAVLLQIICQTTRLWLLVPRTANFGWQKAAIAFIRGQFIGNWVSTQAGHAVKIWHLRPQALENRSLSLISATAIVFLDKVLDIALLMSMSLAGGLWLVYGQSSNGVSDDQTLLEIVTQLVNSLSLNPIWGVLLSLVLVLMILMGIWMRWYPSKRLKNVRMRLRTAFLFLKSPKQTMAAAMMGLGDWFFEILALQILCTSPHHSINLAQTTICLLILNLGISIPSGIANVGAFEASLTFGLTQFGLPLDAALAVAVVYHLMQLTGISIWYLITTMYTKKAPASSAGASRKKIPLR